MPKHSVLAIANEFIERAIRDGRLVTPMQLQKLCYFAHGYDLALFDEPLTKDRVEAWDWGPVYPALYDALKRFGSGAVTELIHQNNWAMYDHIKGSPVKEQFTPTETALIDKVWEEYGPLEAFQLSAITHEAGSAWERVYKPGIRHIPIQDELTRRQFVALTDT